VAASRAKKEKAPPAPDDLVRESAGAYRTGDGRFEVQKSDQGWFLVDTEQSNEFGQQLMHGPLPTLDALRHAIPGARDIKPLLRTRAAASASPKALPSKASPAAPPVVKTKPASPPQTWIDKLPAAEGAEVRRLIRALEKEGLDDAESLVRHHRSDPAPTIATRLLEQRLRALISDQPEGERERARQLVRRVTEILALDGASIGRPAPRWAVVEVVDDSGPTLPRRLRPQV
jgi:hypothetical protein